MVTDTLRVMSMGIMQVSRDAGSHLPTFNSKFKRSSIRCAPANQSRSLKFLRRPHFVGDLLCRRSCINLQLSSESSCKAPSFYVWKTWGCFSHNFCDYLCLGFALGLGLCSGVEVQNICGKLSWIGYWGFRLGFRRKAYTCCIAI
jgi:hypothetical protein